MAAAGAQTQLPGQRDTWVGQPPEPAYIPASPRPREFPLAVRIEDIQEHYDGMAFKGAGDAKLLNLIYTGSAQTKVYSFRCAETFVPNTESGDFYPGRWKDHGRKIQLLLLQKPGSRQTRRCTISLH